MFFQPQNFINLLNSSYVDGAIYCEVERNASTVVEGKSFDLTNQDFYFLLAIGSDVTGDWIFSILPHALFFNSEIFSLKLRRFHITTWDEYPLPNHGFRQEEKVDKMP